MTRRPKALAVLLAILPIREAAADCYLFENPHMDGRMVQIYANKIIEDLGWLEKTTSSVRVDAGCLLIGYEAPKLNGASQVWGPGEFTDLPDGWNDSIASARCNCRPPQ